MRILVVEDEPKAGDYLLRGLEEAGYVVDLARNGVDGLLQQAADDDGRAHGLQSHRMVELLPDRVVHPAHHLGNIEDVLGYLLLVPVFLLLGIFVAYPFLYGVWLALTDTTIVSAGSFIGLDNLTRILADSTFQQAASNSIVYTGVTTVFKLVLGLAMAAILNLSFRGKRRSEAP